MLTTQLYPTPALQLPVTGVTNRIQATTVSLPALQPDRVAFGQNKLEKQRRDSQSYFDILGNLATGQKLTEANARLLLRVHPEYQGELSDTQRDVKTRFLRIATKHSTVVNKKPTTHNTA